MLARAYQEVVPFLPASEQHIRFAGLLIDVRTLVRSLQKRSPNRYTSHQLHVLREDLSALF